MIPPNGSKWWLLKCFNRKIPFKKTLQFRFFHSEISLLTSAGVPDQETSFAIWVPGGRVLTWGDACCGGAVPPELPCRRSSRRGCDGCSRSKPPLGPMRRSWWMGPWWLGDLRSVGATWNRDSRIDFFFFPGCILFELEIGKLNECWIDRQFREQSNLPVRLSLRVLFCHVDPKWSGKGCSCPKLS